MTDDWQRNVVAVRIPVSEQVMYDGIADLWRTLEDGWTVYGPTEPRCVHALPPYDDQASDEWKALYEIADGATHGYDDAADLALETIGVQSWEPGPKPGPRRGLRDALTHAIYRTEEPE